MSEKITLADIKAKQKEHSENLKAYYAKQAEVNSLKNQYHQAEMELDSLTQQARTAVHELRTMGANFALQIEGDFTPPIPGTELPGERMWGVWKASYPDYEIVYEGPTEMPVSTALQIKPMASLPLTAGQF